MPTSLYETRKQGKRKGEGLYTLRSRPEEFPIVKAPPNVPYIPKPVVSTEAASEGSNLMGNMQNLMSIYASTRGGATGTDLGEPVPGGYVTPENYAVNLPADTGGPAQTGTPLMDYWKKPVVGSMPLDQFVMMAGMFAESLAPDTWSGRMGGQLSNLATQIYGTRLKQEMGAPEAELDRRLTEARIRRLDRPERPERPTPSPLGRLQAERAKLGPDDPKRAEYDKRIGILTTRAEKTTKPTYDQFTIHGPKGQTKRVAIEKGKGYTPPEGWSLSKADKERAEAGNLKDLASDYQQAIGRHYSAARGVGQYVADPNKQKVAADALRQSQNIAIQYAKKGGDVRDLGVTPESIKQALDILGEEVRSAPEKDRDATYTKYQKAKGKAAKLLKQLFPKEFN